MDNVTEERLDTHKKAFYIGCILPDCVPSFLTRKHNIDETFHILIKEMKKVTVDYDATKGVNGYYCRHLGVISHYLADYCTFPHNKVFNGTLKEHCAYEKKLKDNLKAYVMKEETQKVTTKVQKKVLSLDEIVKLVQDLHVEYLKAVKEVKEDCMYIVEVCYQVIDAIVVFLQDKLENLYATQKQPELA